MVEQTNPELTCVDTFRHSADSDDGSASSENFYEEPDYDRSVRNQDYANMKVKYGLDRWFRVLGTMDAGYYLTAYQATRDSETGESPVYLGTGKPLLYLFIFAAMIDEAHGIHNPVEFGHSCLVREYLTYNNGIPEAFFTEHPSPEAKRCYIHHVLDQKRDLVK